MEIELFNSKESSKLRTYPCYMLKLQVTLVTKVELCISFVDYKHVLQSYTKFPVLVVSGF